MYLISLYFDQKTTKLLNHYITTINQDLDHSFMLENHVPCHLTLMSFDSKDEAKIIQIFKSIRFDRFDVLISNISILKSQTICLDLVYTKELYELQSEYYQKLSIIQDIHFSQYYQPFLYKPHITLAKKLNHEEIMHCIDLLDLQFKMNIGKIIKVELSKTMPFQVLETIKLPD